MTPNITNVKDGREQIESDDSLHLLSNNELALMQSITLNQMKEAPEPATLFLLGRVWYRLEQERRRRGDDVRELEKLYFTRGH
jgi:hypothetical protein